MPEAPGRDLLVPAVERLRDNGLVFVGDSMNDDLAVLLELPHDVAHVLDVLLRGQHRALVDLELHPRRCDARLMRRELRVAPFGAMAGEAFAGLRIDSICHGLLLREGAAVWAGRRALSP